MNKLLKGALTGAALFATSANLYAACDIEKGNISILANDFPALHAVVNGAEECAGDGVEFAKNHNKDFKDVMIAALTSDPAEFSSVVVSNRRTSLSRSMARSWRLRLWLTPSTCFTAKISSKRQA